MGYAKDYGKLALWQSEAVGGYQGSQYRFYLDQREGAYLHVHGPTNYDAKVRIMGRDSADFANSFLAMQDDGNLVLYSDFHGNRIVLMSSGTSNIGPLPRYVQPNTKTAEVTAGTVAISGPSDGDVVNESGGPIGISDNNTYVTVQHTDSVPVAGTVHLDLVHYDFGNLKPDDARPSVRRDVHNSGDGNPANPGQRYKLTITPGFGLRLFAPIDPESEVPNEGVDLELLRREYSGSDRSHRETEAQARAT